MRKYYFILILMSFNLTNAYPQQKVISLSEKEKMLCFEWKYSLSEEFGVENEPSEMETNDGITIGADKRIEMIKQGKTVTGNWSLDKSGNFLYINQDSSRTKWMFGLKSLTAEKLVLEYQTPDLVRTRYVYIKK